MTEKEKPGPRPGTVAVMPGAAVYVQLPDGNVRAVYLDEVEASAPSTVLGGPVTKWGEVVYEPTS